MLRATTPYTFSTSQRPKVLRDRHPLTLFTSLCVYLCIFSSVKFSLHLSFDLPLDLSINLSSRHVDNKTMLLDFCWQHQKTKQFCETFSLFAVENIKNEAILRDFLQKWKVDCTADGLVPIGFAIFPCHVSKVLRLPRKS